MRFISYDNVGRNDFFNASGKVKLQDKNTGKVNKSQSEHLTRKRIISERLKLTQS